MKSNKRRDEMVVKLRKAACAALINLAGLILLFSATISLKAQEKQNLPELQIAGVKLNDEASGREFLSKYAPRLGENGQPVYYFYNKYATEVLKLTGLSMNQPYMIVGAEVYSVGKNYHEQHFQINEIASFATESNFFVGVRQSAKSLLFGVAEKTDTEKVIKSKGKPDDILKNENRETLTYQFDKLEVMRGGKSVKIPRYVAVYEFYKDKLKKISIKTESSNEL
jgi:hypothetical protein